MHISSLKKKELDMSFLSISICFKSTSLNQNAIQHCLLSQFILSTDSGILLSVQNTYMVSNKKSFVSRGAWCFIFFSSSDFD